MLVLKMKELIDREYEEGRNSSFGDDELVNLIYIIDSKRIRTLAAFFYEKYFKSFRRGYLISDPSATLRMTGYFVIPSEAEESRPQSPLSQGDRARGALRSVSERLRRTPCSDFFPLLTGRGFLYGQDALFRGSRTIFLRTAIKTPALFRRSFLSFVL